ncbi:MAG: hypothetical protein LBQ83_00430 [Candidatus Margulisbacteria bacterium]|jgi:hypothetical protein|nr:hypothetical protein [Candidatus Margulisiibacteriota bacterium]
MPLTNAVSGVRGGIQDLVGDFASKVKKHEQDILEKESGSQLKQVAVNNINYTVNNSILGDDRVYC